MRGTNCGEVDAIYVDGVLRVSYGSIGYVLALKHTKERHESC